MDTKDLLEPIFMPRSGYIEAHLKPTISFSLDSDGYWEIGRASANLIARWAGECVLERIQSW